MTYPTIQSKVVGYYKHSELHLITLRQFAVFFTCRDHPQSRHLPGSLPPQLLRWPLQRLPRLPLLLTRPLIITLSSERTSSAGDEDASPTSKPYIRDLVLEN
ncbi:hypothetical protein J6590_015276 [Homalodisca vitripennis]|nr:hypothetical protein J6590_015276 [Homalodisca vitripennis]